ncbi:MAG: ATP-binding protein [Nannocystaceae bacterium]|nr:GAF domain-containing protein [Myxococcales bacterium]
MPGSNLYDSLSSLLAATVAIAIGISMLLRDRSREQFVLFATFCINLGLFHLAHFFAAFERLELSVWIGETIALVLPWSADRCFSSFIPAAGHRGGGRVQGAFLGLFVTSQMAALIYRPLAEEPAWAYVRVGLYVYVIGGLLYATLRVWRAARAAEGTAARPRLLYLFYASLIALAFGTPGIPALSPIVTAVYLYFVAQTLQRERLLELPEVLGRIASMSILVVAVTAVFALLLLWVPITVESISLRLFNIAVASFAVLVLLDPVRSGLERRMEGWLFRDRSELRAILIGLRHRLVNLIDPEEMASVVIDTLRDSGRVTRASLYLLDRQGMSLSLRGHIGAPGPARIDLALHRPLLERMRTRGTQLRDVIQRERDRAERERKAELDRCLAALRSIGASLGLPILSRPEEDQGDDGEREPELMGALFVDDERLLEPFSRDEIEHFEGVVAQAAVMIQNSTVYEQRKEQDRLAALGQMAAGLAHEIRNPLGAIKGAVQVVEPSMTEVAPETREFLGVIVEEVERLNRVVTQFLRYSRPFKGEMARVDLADVVSGTLRLVDDETRARVELCAPPPDLPQIRGDDDSLRQVVLNLVRNALDAITEHEDGHVTIRLGLRRRGLPGGDAVALSVRDNGPGFSDHTMTNLFVPFHTTKSGGTGMGLPISQRIVENHRGLIEVTTPEGGGAQFTVLLPVDPMLAAHSQTGLTHGTAT